MCGLAGVCVWTSWCVCGLVVLCVRTSWGGVCGLTDGCGLVLVGVVIYIILVHWTTG